MKIKEIALNQMQETATLESIAQSVARTLTNPKYKNMEVAINQFTGKPQIVAVNSNRANRVEISLNVFTANNILVVRCVIGSDLSYYADASASVYNQVREFTQDVILGI